MQQGPNPRTVVLSILPIDLDVTKCRNVVNSVSSRVIPRLQDTLDHLGQCVTLRTGQTEVLVNAGGSRLTWDLLLLQPDTPILKLRETISPGDAIFEFLDPPRCGEEYLAGIELNRSARVQQTLLLRSAYPKILKFRIDRGYLGDGGFDRLL